MARISELIIAIKCLPIELLSDPCINSTIFVSLILSILLILSNLYFASFADQSFL